MKVYNKTDKMVRIHAGVDVLNIMPHAKEDVPEKYAHELSYVSALKAGYLEEEKDVAVQEEKPVEPVVQEIEIPVKKDIRIKKKPKEEEPPEPVA